MQLISSIVFTLLVAAASCHVTVFRDGMWQSIPGRRPGLSGWDSFGMQTEPFGRSWFGSGFPGRVQTPWTSNNMWWNSGFPQIPATDPNNPTQWMNNGNRNQQNIMSDPWATYRLLQGSNNQGINPITDGSPNTQGPAINDPWNTWNTQQVNPALGLNTGNQASLLPNNGLTDQTGQFQQNSNFIGSQLNNQFQGVPNNGMSFLGTPSNFGKKK